MTRRLTALEKASRPLRRIHDEAQKNPTPKAVALNKVRDAIKAETARVIDPPCTCQVCTIKRHEGVK